MSTSEGMTTGSPAHARARRGEPASGVNDARARVRVPVCASRTRLVLLHAVCDQQAHVRDEAAPAEKVHLAQLGRRRESGEGVLGGAHSPP